MKRPHIIHPFFYFLLSLTLKQGLSFGDFSVEKNICEVCQSNLYDTPFYCSIKPDLPQCIAPVCPKICEVLGPDSDMALKIGQNVAVPYAVGTGIKMLPHPPYLPRAGDEYFAPLSTLEAKEDKMKGMGRTVGDLLADDDNAPHSSLDEDPPKPYDDETCRLSGRLEEVTEGSKYIKYRPIDGKKSYANMLEIAGQFGLHMAEIRRPEEVSAITSLVCDVASYTGNQPRIYYAYGFRDSHFSTNSAAKKAPIGKRQDILNPNHGAFTYPSDNSTITYSFLDPRQYGRTDHHCGVLTHISGADKREYLVTKMRDCDEVMQGNEVMYGLFMYPPGSFCYRRSTEECAFKKQKDMGGDAVFHNMIQIGQTPKRFIYFYSDQRTWADAKTFCEAKGLTLLDLDPRWDDALRTAKVIKHFLDETSPQIHELNPATMFWTSGKFANHFSDGYFKWGTTDTAIKVKYDNKPPPFPFKWWDDQLEINKMLKNQSHIPRRKNIQSPCVALALNPENNGERPLINFKAWYCDFPLFFLCYKEINATDNILDGPFVASTVGSRPDASNDSCRMRNVTDPKPVKPEPFDEILCLSKSTVASRLHTYSKFVNYKPYWKTFTVEEIKKKCYEFNLVPAEIRHAADWLSITKSGISHILGGDSEQVDYFYAIGTEDIEELGKYQYTESKDPITFSMFYSEGKTGTTRRCVVLDTVNRPDGNSNELMMHHVDCSLGSTAKNVAYGLCMFKPDSKCYKESQEEISHKNDTKQQSTLAPIGVSKKRSFFFNPVQRTWEEAKKFCERAKLSLLDFDTVQWDDIAEVVTLFKEKVADKAGLNRMSPLWTSGKFQGAYTNKGASGSWESTKGMFDFSPSSKKQWLKYKWENLTSLREGSVQGGCVEASFDDDQKIVKLKPDYCNVPKFFLCYRKSRKRCCDPPPSNSLGIYIIDTGDSDEVPEDLTRGPPLNPDIGKFPSGHSNVPDSFLPSDGEAESDEGALGDDETGDRHPGGKMDSRSGDGNYPPGPPEESLTLQDPNIGKEPMVKGNVNKPEPEMMKYENMPQKAQGANDPKKTEGKVYLDVARPKRMVPRVRPG